MREAHLDDLSHGPRTPVAPEVRCVPSRLFVRQRLIERRLRVGPPGHEAGAATLRDAEHDLALGELLVPDLLGEEQDGLVALGERGVGERSKERAEESAFVCLRCDEAKRWKAPRVPWGLDGLIRGCAACQGQPHHVDGVGQGREVEERLPREVLVDGAARVEPPLDRRWVVLAHGAPQRHFVDRRRAVEASLREPGARAAQIPARSGERLLALGEAQARFLSKRLDRPVVHWFLPQSYRATNRSRPLVLGRVPR
jgi:hypothetical protein